MTPSISLEEWLRFLRQEYLDTFIRDGGAAIKFAVPPAEDSRLEVAQKIKLLGEELGYLTAYVNAEDTKVHLIDHLFFSIAQQVPWQDLSRRILLKLARVKSYAEPGDGDDPLYIRLGRANELDPEFVLMQLQSEISNSIFKNRRLSRDFRIAMTQVSLAELSGGPQGATTVGEVTDWLTGRIKTAKSSYLFNRISRNNSRHLLSSLLYWIRFAGYPGILSVLDIARVTLPRNPRDEKLYYSKAAVWDAYEVLREFIDGTDDMEGHLMIVIGNDAFSDDHPQGRGLGAYDALRLRVYDEVRDRRYVNPMSSLVRLAPSRLGLA